jgi:hypothetical protein
MFDEIKTRSDGQAQIITFALQQCFVPVGILIVSLVCLSVLRPMGSASIFNAYPSLVGIVAGLWVKTLWENAAATGRWIWILPCLSWLYEVMQYESPMSMFASSGGTEGLPLILITIPALGTILYSAAMYVSREPRVGT